MSTFFGEVQDKVDAIETTGKKYEKYYTVSDNTRKAISEITNQLYETIGGTSLPALYDEIIPLRIYKKAVDPSEYKKIKLEYRQVLEAFEYKLEDDKFVLPAITIGEKTYILPDFEKLTPKQQAKYLIHEAGMRSGSAQNQEDRIKHLERVLKVDTAIEKVLGMKKKKDDKNILETLKTLVNLGMLDIHGVFNQIIKLMSEELGRDVKENEIFTFRDFVIDKDDYDDRNKIVVLDPSTIQETQEKYNLKRNYAEMLEGTVFKLSKTGEKESKWFGCSSESNHFNVNSGLLRVNRCYIVSELFGGGEAMFEFAIWVEKAGPFLKKFEK